MATFESILALHPLDTYALHMAFFLASDTGNTAKLAAIPMSVVSTYRPGTPFYGNVHGKISFGLGVGVNGYHKHLL